MANKNLCHMSTTENVTFYFISSDPPWFSFVLFVLYSYRYFWCLVKERIKLFCLCYNLKAFEGGKLGNLNYVTQCYHAIHCETNDSARKKLFQIFAEENQCEHYMHMSVSRKSHIKNTNANAFRFSVYFSTFFLLAKFVSCFHFVRLFAINIVVCDYFCINVCWSS